MNNNKRNRVKNLLGPLCQYVKGCEKDGASICEDTCEAPGFKCTELANIVEKTTPVKASSELKGHPARYGADRKQNTFWATATSGKYFGRNSLFLPPLFFS